MKNLPQNQASPNRILIVEIYRFLHIFSCFQVASLMEAEVFLSWMLNILGFWWIEFAKRRLEIEGMIRFVYKTFAYPACRDEIVKRGGRKNALRIWRWGGWTYLRQSRSINLRTSYFNIFRELTVASTNSNGPEKGPFEVPTINIKQLSMHLLQASFMQDRVEAEGLVRGRWLNLN